MLTHRRHLPGLAAASALLFTQPAAATSLQACLDDLAKYPPAEVAQGYAARLKTEKLPREAAFWAHYCVGRAWKTAGELNKAEPALRAAAKLAQSAQERSGVQSFLGSVLTHMNRLDAAETAHQAALAAAREMGNAKKQAMELNNLAGVAATRKQYDHALALYTRSLTLQPDEEEKASVLNNMASVHSEKGEHSLAVELQQQAIAIRRRHGDQKNIVANLLNLGDSYRVLRQWKDWDVALSEGLQLARANGDRYWEAVGLKYYARGFEADRNWVRAREFYTAALRIFREIGAAGDVAEIGQSLAKLEK